MRNFKKLLCVVLALVVALSAASCSLGKQYAYKKDDIELPIGVYIFYLYQAYSEAQNYAQKLDSYDSTTGRYDGKKSFLKLEITDSDDNTAVAEDWIKDKAKEYTQQAIAVSYEFNKLGATIDEMGPNNMYSEINIYSVYNYQTGQLDYSMDRKLSEVSNSMKLYAAQLEQRSPLARLSGGYGYISDANERAVLSAASVEAGDLLNIQLRDGRIGTRVERVEPGE